MTQNTMTHAIVLGSFSFFFGALLAITNSMTAEDILLRAREDRQNSVSQVIPPNLYDNNPVTDSIILKDTAGQDITVYRALKNGKVTGLAYEIHGSGYSGEVKLMMGVDIEGKVLGVRVISHQETPGLGDRINEKKTDWILHFTGLSLGNPPIEQWKVKKDGGKFDQFSGATITPRAVVGAVRGGLELFAMHQKEMTEAR
ncbi:SoxR (2Fe-2S) reducing system protein RsxG [Gammaproteobacteria bacterium]